MLKFWFSLVIVAVAVAIFLFGKASCQVVNYVLLNSKASVEIERLYVEKLGSSKFAIAASYHFERDGKNYQGKTIFSHLYYLNSPTAEKAIKNLKDKSWEVYFFSLKPSYSSLQKMFPFKSCIHAILGIGVLVYFYFLRGYLLRLEG